MAEPTTQWLPNAGFITGEIAYDDPSTTYDSATTRYDGAAAGTSPISSSQNSQWTEVESNAPQKSQWSDVEANAPQKVLWS